MSTENLIFKWFERCSKHVKHSTFNLATEQKLRRGNKADNHDVDTQRAEKMISEKSLQNLSPS